MDICLVQNILQIEETGILDELTKAAIKNFQYTLGIPATGELTDDTYNKLILRSNTQNSAKENTDKIIDHPSLNLDATTDLAESALKINTKYLDSDQYYADKQTKIEYIFLHHTAGWNNPYSVVEDWNKDSRGRIGTTYVIGGTSIKSNAEYDGTVVQCIPDLFWASHLGSFKEHGIVFNMHKNSIGIELCNFGALTKKNDKYFTYAGSEVNKSEVIEVNFRGNKYWHSYSEKQLKSLNELLKLLIKKYNISTSTGLAKLAKFNPKTAFDWMPEACSGKIKGILSHTNVRKDKLDVYPHPGLINLLNKIWLE